MLPHFPNGLRQGFARDRACKIRLILFCLQDKDGIAMAARRMSVELQTKSAKISRVRSELTLQAGKKVARGRHLWVSLFCLEPGDRTEKCWRWGKADEMIQWESSKLSPLLSSTRLERTPSSIIHDVIMSTLQCDGE